MDTSQTVIDALQSFFFFFFIIIYQVKNIACDESWV